LVMGVAALGMEVFGTVSLDLVGGLHMLLLR
jgi:hypothetical protein